MVAHVTSTPGIADVTVVDGQGGLEGLDLLQQPVNQLEGRWLGRLQWRTSQHHTQCPYANTCPLSASGQVVTAY